MTKVIGFFVYFQLVPDYQIVKNIDFLSKINLIYTKKTT
ncbi:hypothetical protein BD847_1457 [Flavobacterium cutihirudinis]|uniref:Uncharacterized protein n=1 Tax=Flavobacterium cutihirudinis TaxID=1265740 RepID=A0A3D9FX88_9FLAO|nr:hypothetical protein BD847_1457 [Flavobacterium cutihirudinis]